jgi:hypothetical protein
MGQSATDCRPADAGEHGGEGRSYAYDRSFGTLIELGRSVLEQSEPQTVLERVLDAARALTGRATRRWGYWTSAGPAWSSF